MSYTLNFRSFITVGSTTLHIGVEEQFDKGIKFLPDHYCHLVSLKGQNFRDLIVFVVYTLAVGTSCRQILWPSCFWIARHRYVVLCCKWKIRLSDAFAPSGNVASDPLDWLGAMTDFNRNWNLFSKNERYSDWNRQTGSLIRECRGTRY